MAQNKSRGVSGAQSMTEFPLNTYNLKDDLVKHLYPLLLTTAVIIAGNPGVGKTPTVIAMAMAIGRFHIERLGLQGVLPGWRRAKSLDNFRQRAPQIQEAIFLDDPSKRKVDVADLKAFVTVDEDGTVEGRYCDARLLRNQMRAYASNDTGEDPKDTKPGDTTLSTDSFMKLVHPLSAMLTSRTSSQFSNAVPSSSSLGLRCTCAFPVRTRTLSSIESFRTTCTKTCLKKSANQSTICTSQASSCTPLSTRPR